MPKYGLQQGTQSQMKKIITIVGARPQFIKTPLVSQEIKKFAREIIIHTGQHYDPKMSEIFFKELKIKPPKYNLSVGSGLPSAQTAEMLAKMELIFVLEKPDLVLIYGDTNSTLAGALTAAKLHIPVAHIEAGMRSYNRLMPEEINRIVADHLASLLFCPTRGAVKILAGEGIRRGVRFTGDVSADIQNKIKNQKAKSKILEKLSLKSKEYYLATIHRQENTDNKQNLQNILIAFSRLDKPVIWPIHPRTQKYLEQYHLMKLIQKKLQIRLVEPIGLADMFDLENNAALILTDSGGVQKEAYLSRVPCLTLRADTEWPETVRSGWNYLVGTNVKKILKLTKKFPRPKSHPNFLGKGQASIKIAQIIKKYLKI